MASTTSILPLVTRLRGRSFILPREHGAWGMLVVPLVTGAAAGNPHGERIIWIFLFAAVALGLFFLRTPVEAALGFSPLRPQNDGERRLVHSFISIYSCVSLMALTLLMLWAHAYGLLALGAIVAMAFLLQAVLKQLGRETRMNAQLTGAIALSSTGAGAYYLATGHFGSMPSLSGWPIGFSQPTRYISFSFEFILRGPRRPGKNCAKAGASCFTKASPCCSWD